MRNICLILLLLMPLKAAEARSTWEKSPQTWSEKDCNSILQNSPWSFEKYQPTTFGSDSHYILRTLCLSPVILWAQARLEQLQEGKDLEFLKKAYADKRTQLGLDKEDLLIFRIVPLRGNGWRGQNLKPLYQSDPFFTGLPENIQLIAGSEARSPILIKPHGGSLSDGFDIYFQNQGFVTGRTFRLDLVLDTGAGEFKIKFEPRQWRPMEVKPKF